MQPGVGNAVLKAALTTGALTIAGDLLAQSFTHRHGKVCTSTVPKENYIPQPLHLCQQPNESRWRSVRHTKLMHAEGAWTEYGP